MQDYDSEFAAWSAAADTVAKEVDDRLDDVLLLGEVSVS
jgi:hypothetical protein